MSKTTNYLEGLNPENIDSFSERGYYQAALEVFNDQENRTFSNGKYAHALWGMYKLFEMAEDSVVIFSGKLKEKIKDIDFYANQKFLEIVQFFLDKNNTKLRIITEAPLSAEHPFYQLNGDVSIKTLQGEKYNFDQHFIVADNKAYRFESEEYEKKGEHKVKAEFNFNNPESAKTLTTIFNFLQEDSK